MSPQMMIDLIRELEADRRRETRGTARIVSRSAR
jgi:hypothetical protein